MGETESRIMNLIGKVAALEATVSMLEKKLDEVNKTVQKLSTEMASLQAKMLFVGGIGALIGNALVTLFIKQIGG